MNKKFLGTGAVLAIVSSMGPSAFAQDMRDGQTFSYYGAGLGNRGRGSLLGGFKRGTLGFQFGVFNNLDFNKDRFSTINPPTDTRFFGTYRTEPGFGIDTLLFLGQKDQSLYVGIGLYAQVYSNVWRSPSTELLFDFGPKTILEGAYSLGFMASTGPDSTFGFGFHTHLGWHLTVGFRK